ncbi:N,N'-diacetylbacillosaminyl-diphospho-undecaprenol alpha-1,3-N-acetylgalactosaminyltransferase [mine drainage metagenome]|uniref:N, N'-diacetylbacillosaminyl-diphospho-undecaprenol alpha-1,3-N-acetylgalactosaminyltransferase n=1 Tax=mine drainage metagenome TaxID=410659 RepID=A0A1J5RI92_9ZZZZ
MKKLCYVATIPAVVHAFLRVHIQTAADKYEVTVICNAADKHLLEGLNARLILLPIERKPSPLKDMLVLLQLFKLFRNQRFDIVHSIMPKTGMLAMIAAKLARVPVRIHTFTGQVWVTKRGVQRDVLKWFDKLIGSFATCALADSTSQRDFLVNEGVLSSSKAKVIGAGSICGVDSSRFHPDMKSRQETRLALGIAQNSKVILFVGRLNHDKGMLDLAAAFDTIARQHPNVVLLLVGAQEDVPFSRIQEICHAERERLRYISFASKPEHYMTAADIFCLPSYREGFGMTIIEAAACGVPAVASRIYGITDAVAEDRTGLLIPAGDVTALTQALSRLLTDNELRQQMGNEARTRALELFSSEKITRELMALYDRLSETR